jgi:CubicO group peptidase (beta-lactamase class C family)
MPARLVASEKPTRGALTRRNVLTGMAALTSGSPAFGRKASQLSDLDAAFDNERKRLGVPSVGVASVEDGRVRLHQRGLRDDVVAMDTPYQAAFISKTVAALTTLAMANANSLSLDADVAT